MRFQYDEQKDQKNLADTTLISRRLLLSLTTHTP